MSDERLLGERLGRIEQRVKTLEDAASSRGGPLAAFKAAAIVIGVVGGILGGTSTILQIRRDLIAKPRLVMEPGTQLRMDWNAADHSIDFKCLVRLTNNGDAEGALNKLHARLASCDGSSPRFAIGQVRAIRQTTVSDFGSAFIQFPLTIDKRTFSDIELSIPSEAIARLEDVFGLDRPYQLAIELDPSSIHPQGQTYSFALGKAAIATLVGADKRYTQTGSDPRCTGKEKA